MAKNVQTRNQISAIDLQGMSPDDLKSLVREGLVAMTIADREIFYESLETEMKHAELNIRAYLVPLGIPGRSAEDLTPNEVGHLLRYLKINVPKSLAPMARVLNRFGAFSDKTSRPLAA
ncbi:MAG TPA: hypothetical protein VFV34_19480 [Blastocatellia bacterium]|nr:hypothetical protein [Blastocatellia bacterium]